MNEVILKADRRGRLRYTPEPKQALVAAKLQAFLASRGVRHRARAVDHRVTAVLHGIR